MDPWLQSLLHWLALPQHGLSTVFVVSLVSATLLPMASVPAVYGLIKLNPDLFWPALLVATAGNTAGGAITYWMGLGAEVAYEKLSGNAPHEARALAWLQRYGPPAWDEMQQIIHVEGTHRKNPGEQSSGGREIENELLDPFEGIDHGRQVRESLR